MKKILIMIISICLLSLPAFGYTYNANLGQDAAGDGIGFTALDGTWSHNNGSDNWDGMGILAPVGAYPTNPGGTIADMPGGIECMTSAVDGTQFLRLQNPGATRDLAGDPYKSAVTGSDKANFSVAHELAGFTDNFLSDGDFHMEVRWRLATEVDGEIDQVHVTRDGGPVNTMIEKPWPAMGDGDTINSNGKGMIYLHQKTGAGAYGSVIGFSLAPLDSEVDNRSQGGFLVMNDLVGNIVSGDADFGKDPTATHNLLYIPNIEDWHTYEIDIVADFDGIGTHDVTVTVDSMFTQTFTVTAAGDDTGDNYDYTGINHISLGSTQSRGASAFDIDYLTVTPEPMTIALMGLGGLGLLRRRRA